MAALPAAPDPRAQRKLNRVPLPRRPHLPRLLPRRQLGGQLARSNWHWSDITRQPFGEWVKQMPMQFPEGASERGFHLTPSEPGSADLWQTFYRKKPRLPRPNSPSAATPLSPSPPPPSCASVSSTAPPPRCRHHPRAHLPRLPTPPRPRRSRPPHPPPEQPEIILLGVKAADTLVLKLSVGTRALRTGRWKSKRAGCVPVFPLHPMPRKIRELIADLERVGWRMQDGGKGSHRKFAHPRCRLRSSSAE